MVRDCRVCVRGLRRAPLSTMALAVLLAALLVPGRCLAAEAAPPTTPGETPRGPLSTAPRAQPPGGGLAPDGPPRAAVGGVGLDAVLSRPTRDSWVLTFQQLYETQDRELVRRIRAAVEQASKTRTNRAAEVPIDSDEDGVADLWVYFADERPAYVELDRFQTGGHDMRVALEQDELKFKEHLYWFTEPPVPLPEPSAAALRVGDFYDRAAADEGRAARSRIARTAETMLPGLAAEVAALAKTAGDKAAQAELGRREARAMELLPQFVRTFEEEKLADALRHSRGWKVNYQPHDLDGRPGRETLVGYSPEGVVQIQFFKQDCFEDPELLADCHFERDAVFRIDLGDARWFRVGGHWVRLRPDVRPKIAETCLLPAFVRYRQGDWYAAVATWQRGLRLAGLTGDYRTDDDGLPESALQRDATDNWGFRVGGWEAGSLLDLAVGFVKHNRYSAGIAELPRQAERDCDYSQALELYRLWSRYARKSGNTNRQILALEGMSAVYARLGNFDQAIQCLLQSLDLESGLAYARDMVEGLSALVNERSAERGLSWKAAMESATEMRSHAMAVNRACKLAELAALYAAIGERQKAERDLDEAERLLKNLGHQYGQADALMLRAEWDLADGRPERAIERLQLAVGQIDAQRTSPDILKETEKSSSLRGRAFHVFEFPEGSFNRYRVFLSASTPPEAYRAVAAGLLGQAYLQLARTADADRPRAERLRAEAVARLKEAREGFQQVRNAEGEMVARLRRAAAAHDAREFATAADAAQKLADEAGQQRLFEVRWRSLALAGAALAAAAKSDEAIRAYRAAADEIESLRGAMHSETVRRGFFGSRLAVYEELARLYAQSGSDAEVWACMERSKARTLLDVVAGEPLAPKGPEVVRLARSAPLVLQRLRGASQSGRLAPEQFERELSQSLERLADQAEAQELLSLASVRPASLKAVQAALDGEQLLIEYLATEQELLAAVVSRDGLRIERLPDYGAAALGRAVAALRGLAQDPRSRYEDQARKLFDGLLAPCLSANPRATHLVIVPSGALHYLPFQALVDSAGKFVVERRMVSYAPSATALLYCLQKGKATEGVTAGGALVVGQSAALAAFPDFPPLPCAEREAEQVHARFRSALPLLQNASETAVKAALPKAGVLHFAGHAEMVPNAPLRSALLCGDTVQDDGRLEVRELFAMDLRHCRMAVLSACRTQVGQWSRGDEMVGLSAAFLRAGVPTVVASLWDLPDEPAARIMVRFYEGLDSRGAMRLAALCQAQRDYLAGKLPALPGPPPSALVSRGALALGPLPKTADAYRHPYYWAGFQLLGDWR